MKEEYYINFSYASNNWLVKKVGGEDPGKIIQIFNEKEKAEKFIKELELKKHGKTKNG
jgi:hypothetical protein